MFRLLPYLIIFLSVNFVFRTLNLVTDNTLSLVSESQAEGDTKGEKEQTKTSSKKDDNKKEGEKNTDTKPTKEEEEKPPNMASGEGEKKEDHLEAKNEDSEGKKVKGPITTSDQGWTPVISGNENVQMNFSNEEIQLLKDLVARRQKLDMREKDLSFKENSLIVIDQNIDNKVKQLNILQDKVSTILQDYEKRDRQKVTGLVKIYENMKPKDAARIFDELQMSILIDVAESMKEAKLAPIIAQMDSNKAKELTVAIASRRRL